MEAHEKKQLCFQIHCKVIGPKDDDIQTNKKYFVMVFFKNVVKGKKGST